MPADFDEEVTFTSWAPKIGLDYQFNPDVMGYVKVNRGFKSGGFNVRAQDDLFPDSALPFDDEIMTVGEIGVKTVLANRSLVLNIAAFYGDYTDIQVSTFTSYDSNGDGDRRCLLRRLPQRRRRHHQGSRGRVQLGLEVLVRSVGFPRLPRRDPDEFLDENGDGFVDTQVITNAPEFTGAIRANFDFPAFGGLITAQRRLHLSRRVGADQRGRSRSAGSDRQTRCCP